MKEVSIVGKAPSGQKCPFEGEVWGINDVPAMYPDKHFDKLFAFDPMEKVSTGSEDLKFMKSTGIPIVSVQKYADEKYPIEEIKKKFGRTYFMASVAYAIAYALLYGYEKINLYGTDYKLPEYLKGKGSVEYWIGRAESMGVIVEVQPESYLVRTIWTLAIPIIKPTVKPIYVEISQPSP